MKLRELFEDGKVDYSFEFFPPKTEEQEKQLWRAISELEPLAPVWVSVTEGAGGSTRDRTHRVVTRVAAETAITPVAHVTCKGVDVDSLRAAIASYRDAGIENLLALRGDPDPGAGFVAEAGGYDHAGELVELIHTIGDFCVGVAGYPEKHPEAPDWDSDIGYLVDKVRRGADFIVTQFFFEADDFFRLRDALAGAGVHVPVIPGIMPVTAVKSITRMAELQGSAFPADLAARLLAVEADADAVRAVGVEFCTKLCVRLLEGGAPGLHFFTLNRSTATREIAANLGLGAGAG